MINCINSSLENRKSKLKIGGGKRENFKSVSEQKKTTKRTNNNILHVRTNGRMGTRTRVRTHADAHTYTYAMKKNLHQ